MPEPADSAEALSHTVAQVIRYELRLQVGSDHVEPPRRPRAELLELSSYPVAVPRFQWIAFRHLP